MCNALCAMCNVQCAMRNLTGSGRTYLLYYVLLGLLYIVMNRFMEILFAIGLCAVTGRLRGCGW
jgi:hypothetical protein